MGSSKSYAHTAGYEIDFNGNGDLGRSVAAAAGTVVMSDYRTTDGFGNVVKILRDSTSGKTAMRAYLQVDGEEDRRRQLPVTSKPVAGSLATGGFGTQGVVGIPGRLC